MSPTLIATICGLITAGGFGVGDWLTAKASKRGDKFEINLAAQFYGTLLLLSVLLFFSLKLPSAGQLAITFLISCLITVAYLLLIKALSIGAVGTVVPLADSYPLPALLLSIIFLGARFSGGKIGAMIIIMLGVILLAYEKNHRKLPLRALHQATFLATCAMIFYGLDFFFIGMLINKMSWQVLDLSTSIFLVLIAFVLLIIKSRCGYRRAVRRALSNRLNLYMGTCFAVGAISFYFGSQRAGSIIIPTLLSACAPLVASILGALFDHEKLGGLKRLGALGVVVGIILLNIVA